LAEAEYRALTMATCELTWLDSLLLDLDVSSSKLNPLFCGNQVALHIGSNLVFFIKIDYHVVRDKVQEEVSCNLHMCLLEGELFPTGVSNIRFKGI
jgi:hypothetical protein